MPERADIAGRPVLVTGARGFLGSNLCRALVGLGAEVHATSRTPEAGDDFAHRWWATDLTDSAAVASLVRELRPACVFHLAGQVSAAVDSALVLPTFHSLLETSVNLLRAVSDPDMGRLVLAGSLTEPVRADEVPGSPYAAAKWAARGYARMFRALYGTRVVIARPFMAYGPRQHASKLIPYVALCVARGESPKLSSGRGEVDWVYVDDVVRGLLLSGFAPSVDGGEFDLGSGRLVTLREVAERVRDAIDPKIPIEFGAREDRPIERPARADVAATKASLGWVPTISLEEGLTRTARWYVEKHGERAR